MICRVGCELGQIFHPLLWIFHGIFLQLMHPSIVCQQWRRLAYEVLLFDTAASKPRKWVGL